MQRNGFRKREIAFAVGMGALAAGGAAVTLAALHDDERSEQRAAAREGRDYQLAPFRRIAISGSQDVEVTYGGTLSVHAEGSPAALNQLEVTVENGKLSIRPKSELFGANWDMFDDVVVRVTLPDLDQVELAGSSEVRIDRVEGKNFAGKVSGSGSIAIDRLEVARADFDVSGSGDLTASGTADDATVTVNGSGDVHADGMLATTAAVSVTGSGSAAIGATRSADVAITGSGDVDISGPAHCSIRSTGSGSARCAGDGDAADED